MVWSERKLKVPGTDGGGRCCCTVGWRGGSGRGWTPANDGYSIAPEDFDGPD